MHTELHKIIINALKINKNYNIKGKEETGTKGGLTFMSNQRANSPHFKQIFKEKLVQRRHLLWHAYKNGELSIEHFQVLVGDLSNDPSYLAEVKKAISAFQFGLTPEEPDLSSPEKQFIWGAFLATVQSKPEIVQNWRAFNVMQEEKKLVNSYVWHQLTGTKDVKKELYLSVLNADVQTRKSENKIKIGQPGRGTHYLPSQHLMVFDLFESLIHGFDIYRAHSTEVISKASLSKKYPVKMQSLSKKIKSLKSVQAAKKKNKQPFPKEQLRQLNKASVEWNLYRMFLEACDGNTHSKDATDMSSALLQDLSFCFNFFATSYHGAGPNPVKENALRPIFDETKVAEFIHLCRFVNFTFYETNGLLRHENDFRQIGIDPNAIRRRPRFGIMRPGSNDYKKLREKVIELQSLKPTYQDRRNGDKYYDVKVREYNEKRLDIIQTLWRDYAEHLANEIVKEQQEKLEEEMDQTQDQDQSQDGQDGEGQDSDGEGQDQDGQEGEGQPSDGQPSDSQNSSNSQSKSDQKSQQSNSQSQNGEPSENSEPSESQDNAQSDPSDSANDNDQQQDSQSNGQDQDSAEQSDQQQSQDGQNSESSGSDPSEQDADGQNGGDDDLPFDHRSEDETVDVEDTGEMKDIDDVGDTPEEQAQKDAGEKNDGDGQDGQDQQNGQDQGDQGNEGQEEGQTADQLQQDMNSQDQGDGDDGDAEGDEADGQDSDSQSQQNKQNQKNSPKSKEGGQDQGKDKVDIIDGGWDQYQEKVNQLQGPISRVAKQLERIKKKQLQTKTVRSRSMTLTPRAGEMDRFNSSAQRDLKIRQKTKQKMELEHFERFHDDQNEQEETTVELILLVDASGSMTSSHNTQHSPMDVAITTAVIIYEAAQKVGGMRVHLGLWGDENVVWAVKPEDNRYQIGKNFEAARNGRGTGTQLSPAIRETAHMYATEKTKPGDKTGYTHILIISDGDVNRNDQPAKHIEHLMKNVKEVTIDAAIITPRDSDKAMEQELEKVKTTKRHQEITIAKKADFREMPLAITDLLCKKIVRSKSFVAVPTKRKRSAMRRAHNRMRQK